MLREWSPPKTCHILCVTCHMSHVKKISLSFYGQSGEAYRLVEGLLSEGTTESSLLPNSRFQQKLKKNKKKTVQQRNLDGSSFWVLFVVRRKVRCNGQ